MPPAEQKTMTFGERIMAAAVRVPDLRENQMEILRWLYDLGHEIEDVGFFEDLEDDYYVWCVP